MAMIWISPYINIYWTKRLVRHRPCGLRITLKKLKYKNRIKKIPNVFMIKHKIECMRKPYKPKHPQCRNYNSYYRPMQIPA